jgi:type IV pilus biogenesis protein PilP
MGNVNKVLGIIFLILLPSISYAETTVYDLDVLQSQRVLWEARAAVNKAKAAAEGSASSSLSTTSNIPGKVVTSDDLPRLVKINGSQAEITLPGGDTTIVTSGQVLPGGRWQVLSIRMNGVKLRDINNSRTIMIN